MEVLASAAETPSYLPSHRKIGTKTDWNKTLGRSRTFVLNQVTFGTFVLNEGSRGALSQGHFLSAKCVLLSKYYFVLTTFSLSHDNLRPMASHFVDSTSGTSIG
eukprot:scaffold3301_cov141-Skeletonema_dohrnii-CCMP3373.AAC.2